MEYIILLLLTMEYIILLLVCLSGIIMGYFLSEGKLIKSKKKKLESSEYSFEIRRIDAEATYFCMVWNEPIYLHSKAIVASKIEHSEYDAVAWIQEQARFLGVDVPDIDIKRSIQ